MKEFICIKDLYETAKRISDEHPELDYIRNNIDKNILRSYCYIGILSENEILTLNTKSAKIKLSIDTTIKNILKHNELTINDYENIKNYLQNATYILQANNKNLIYFKIDNEIYQIVIKTTKDKKENFLTTFHKSSNQQLTKDLQKYKKLKR